MHLLISLLPLVLLAAGVILCACIFFSLKKEIQDLKNRLENNELRLQIALQGAQAEMANLKESIRDAEDRAGLMVAPSPPRSGFNLNKRSQALRMYRRGEVSEKIASSLGLAKREVDLLVKVQKIVIGGTSNPTS